MPTTMRTTRKNNNLKRFNYLCFSTFIHPFTPPSSSLLQNQQQIDHNRPSLSTASATSSSFMIKNFNTLYHHHHKNTSPEPDSEPQPEPQPADFATAFASNRFFFSSPGRSNSIIESSSSSSSSSSLTATVPAPVNDSDSYKNKAIFNGSVAVPTYSPDPYMDFRRSMQEMVEARPELMNDVKSNWDTLHELLLSYLALNPKSTHKFILGAFSDLIVTLMSLSSSSSSSSCSYPPPPQNSNCRGCGGGC